MMNLTRMFFQVKINVFLKHDNKVPGQMHKKEILCPGFVQEVRINGPNNLLSYVGAVYEEIMGKI